MNGEMYVYQLDRPCSCRLSGRCAWCEVETILDSEIGPGGTSRIRERLRDWANFRENRGAVSRASHFQTTSERGTKHG